MFSFSMMANGSVSHTFAPRSRRATGLAAKPGPTAAPADRPDRHHRLDDAVEVPNGERDRQRAAARITDQVVLGMVPLQGPYARSPPSTSPGPASPTRAALVSVGNLASGPANGNSVLLGRFRTMAEAMPPRDIILVVHGSGGIAIIHGPAPGADHQT
jgi:hypothetical protein